MENKKRAGNGFTPQNEEISAEKSENNFSMKIQNQKNMFEMVLSVQNLFLFGFCTAFRTFFMYIEHFYRWVQGRVFEVNPVCPEGHRSQCLELGLEKNFGCKKITEIFCRNG